MKRTSFLVLLLILGITGVSGQGLFESSLAEGPDSSGKEYLSIGGFIRSAIYLGKTPLEQDPYLQSAYGQAGLLMKAKAGNRATALADIRFRHGTEWQQTISEIELREAYVDLQSGPLGFRLGKLISPWGKGTLFNPTNKLTPMDPATRSPETDDMNLGIWALQGNLYLGSLLKLTATWNPLYRPGKLLTDPIPMPGYVSFLEPEYPGVKLDEGSYGIRLDLHAPVMDASLYWFDGYHGWPGISFDSFILDSLSMEPVSLSILEKAYKIRMAGVDLSIPAGAWIFRVEGAWLQANNDHKEREYLPFPEISYTAEAERSGSWWTTIAGYYGKFIMDYSPALAEPLLSAEREQFLPLMQGGMPDGPETVNAMIIEQVAAFNRLYNYQLEENYHSVFLVLKGDFFHNKLEIHAPVLYNISTDEWMARPAVSWMPADGLRVKAGLHGLWGSKHSLYDMVGPVLNAGFLSMTLTF
ncbi:MAG: hypothetical protein P1P86_03155 [Bacteroidales bacterium]|nr:hypothetical protein [Bacteroidales bacterium]